MAKKAKVKDTRWFLLIHNNPMQGDFNWAAIPEVAKGPVIKLGVLLGRPALVVLVFAACSSAPTTSGSTPTLLPALIETPTSVSTPRPASTALPAQDLTPASTSTAALSPTPIPVPAASLPVNLEGLEITSDGSVIKVSLIGLPESVVDQVQSLPQVTKVERYLKVATPDYPNPFIGMEPGSALRVGDTIVTLAVGEGFQSRDERVAIPGVSLNSNHFISGGEMSGMMVHNFMPGQSFLVKGVRLRVVGLFRSPDKGQEQAMLLPLGTAQELFGFQGQLTSIFVTVNGKEKVEEVVAEIKKILSAT